MGGGRNCCVLGMSSGYTLRCLVSILEKEAGIVRQCLYFSMSEIREEPDTPLISGQNYYTVL